MRLIGRGESQSRQFDGSSLSFCSTRQIAGESSHQEAGTCLRDHFDPALPGGWGSRGVKIAGNGNGRVRHAQHSLQLYPSAISRHPARQAPVSYHPLCAARQFRGGTLRRLLFTGQTVSQSFAVQSTKQWSPVVDNPLRCERALRDLSTPIFLWPETADWDIRKGAFKAEFAMNTQDCVCSVPYILHIFHFTR